MIVSFFFLVKTLMMFFDEETWLAGIVDLPMAAKEHMK